MKKPKVFLTAAIILLMVLTGLVGCTFSGALDGPTGTTPDNTQPTTVPNTTTAPNPTVVPPTTAVPPTSVPELSTVIVQEMFTYNEEVRKPYYFALGCEFANPKEIVLYNFFRGGWGPGTATDAEKEELKQYYNESWLERAKIYRLPKARMNGELQKYFGISLEDLPDTAFRYLTYLESSDCYCYVGTDSNVYVRNYTVQSVENQDDGTVKVEYTYSEPTLGTHIMFLKHNGRDFQILSNRHSVFDDPELNFFNDLFSTDDPTQRNYYFWATGHTYSSPTQINLKKYFDGGFSDETEITDEEREGLAKLTISQGALNVDCSRLPKDKMNAELMEAFGITLADLPQSAYEGLYYLESTDCYYIIQGGMTSVPKHSPLYEIEHNDDGTVSLTYNIPGGTGKITLKPNGDDYLILSNIHAPVII